MTDNEREFDTALLDAQAGKMPKEALQTAGKIAIAAALATTLSAGPVNDKAYVLPDPTPIVYVLPPDVPDQPVAEPEDAPEEKTSLWQKILKILKYALIALLLLAALLLAALLFGALKGCAALGGALPFVPGSESSASASAAVSAPSSEAVPAAA